MAERLGAASGSALDGLVRRLRLHSHLADADADAIRLLPHRLRRIGTSSQLFREGDPTQECSVLVSGFMHRFRFTEDGQRQITAIYVPGDPVDFDHLFLPTADDGLQASKDCVLACIRHQHLRALLAIRPAIAEVITRALLVDSSIFREWTLNVGRRNARTRIAHLICEISIRVEAQGQDLKTILFPMTQDQIADATGLTAVHVNRTLKGLSAQGLIRRKGGTIMLSNAQSLREFAGFDPRYLHFREELG